MRGQETRLPPTIRSCLFDLDGVLMSSASTHAAAWKRMFDEFLQTRADRVNEAFVPFDEVADYTRYVDGMRREDGVRTFLASRRIVLPEGTPTDSANAETVYGLGTRKNEILLDVIEANGVDVFPGSLAFVRAVRSDGLSTAVVSSSTNAVSLLRVARIDDLFDVCVDGIGAVDRGLAGKPAPDTFLAAADALGVAPANAAVFEDALVGVEAGRAGNFGLVVGVNRKGNADELRARGADIVVDDLEDLLGEG